MPLVKGSKLEINTPFDMITGQVHRTNCGPATVIKYINSAEVIVEFNDGFRKSFSSASIRKGNIKNPFYKTVYGVGYLGIGPHKTESKHKGQKSTEYIIWSSMIQRCYGLNRRTAKTYSDCNVHADWHNFQNFAEWFINEKQNGYYQEGWHLDKDILGGREYSAQNCLFVPSKLNSCFTCATIRNKINLVKIIEEMQNSYKINPKIEKYKSL